MNESQAMIDFNPDRLGHCVYLVSTFNVIINFMCVVTFYRLRKKFNKWLIGKFQWKYVRQVIWPHTHKPSKQRATYHT